MSRKEVPRARQEGALQHGARVERVAAPCDEVVTSKRNSNSLLACRWLRAHDMNQRPEDPADVANADLWITASRVTTYRGAMDGCCEATFMTNPAD